MNISLHRKLSTATIKDFVEYEHRKKGFQELHDPTKTIIFFKEHDIQTALRLFAANDILSAPVRDVELKITGMVDMLDIVTYIMEVITESEQAEYIHGRVDFDFYVKNPELLRRRGVMAFHTPVLQIVDESKSDRFCPVYSDGTVFQLMEVFEKGVHRCVVFDADKLAGSTEPACRPNEVLAVVSQSSVVHHVATHLMSSINRTLLRKPIQEALSLNRNVVSMSSNAPAVQAFYLMHFNKVNCVAVVNEQEYLIGDINTDDIRGMNPRNISDLLLNVMEFIDKVEHRKSAVTGDPKGLIVCRADDTFECILMKMALLKTHHLWVVDDAAPPSDQSQQYQTYGKVIGLITLTDVIRVLMS